jgi:hypothetical protein
MVPILLKEGFEVVGLDTDLYHYCTYGHGFDRTRRVGCQGLAVVTRSISDYELFGGCPRRRYRARPEGAEEVGKSLCVLRRHGDHPHRLADVKARESVVYGRKGSIS